MTLVPEISFISSLVSCVCVHVYVHVNVCALMWENSEPRDQAQVSFLRCLLPYFFEAELNSAYRLEWLCREPGYPPVSTFPVLGLKHTPSLLVLTCIWGIETQILMLV